MIIEKYLFLLGSSGNIVNILPRRLLAREDSSSSEISGLSTAASPSVLHTPSKFQQQKQEIKISSIKPSSQSQQQALYSPSNVPSAITGLAYMSPKVPSSASMSPKMPSSAYMSPEISLNDMKVRKPALRLMNASAPIYSPQSPSYSASTDTNAPSQFLGFGGPATFTNDGFLPPPSGSSFSFSTPTNSLNNNNSNASFVPTSFGSSTMFPTGVPPPPPPHSLFSFGRPTSSINNNNNNASFMSTPFGGSTMLSYDAPRPPPPFPSSTISPTGAPPPPPPPPPVSSTFSNGSIPPPPPFSGSTIFSTGTPPPPPPLISSMFSNVVPPPPPSLPSLYSGLFGSSGSNTNNNFSMQQGFGAQSMPMRPMFQPPPISSSSFPSASTFSFGSTSYSPATQACSFGSSSTSSTTNIVPPISVAPQQPPTSSVVDRLSSTIESSVSALFDPFSSATHLIHQIQSFSKKSSFAGGAIEIEPQSLCSSVSRDKSAAHEKGKRSQKAGRGGASSVMNRTGKLEDAPKSEQNVAPVAETKRAFPSLGSTRFTDVCRIR
jgi:hypothetical protein